MRRGAVLAAASGLAWFGALGGVEPAAAAADDACPTRGLTGPARAVVGGPHVRVSYPTAMRGGRAEAVAVRNAVEGHLWPRFRRLLGRTPPRDGGVRGCPNGGDGRLDVYVVASHALLRGDRVAVYRPYGERVCAPREPGVVLVRRGASRAIVAHELFHAFQAAFPRGEACIEYSEWDEATATWAMHHAYPRDDDEHRHLASRYVDYPFEFSGYGAWLYVYLLTQRHGAPIVRTIFERQEQLGPFAAVDSALDGKGAESVADYAVAAWNHPALPSTAYGPSFRTWDRLRAVAKPVRPLRLSLGGRAIATFPLDDRIRIRAANVRRIVPDADVRWIEVRPLRDPAATPNGRVAAFVRTAAGWTYVPHDELAVRRWCRDVPGEDVREIVLLTVNTYFLDRGAVPLRPEGAVRAAAACPPATIAGAFSGSILRPASVSLTWTGDVSFVHRAPDPFDLAVRPDDVTYDVTGGSVSWSASGTDERGCAVSGSGTLGAADLAGAASITLTGVPDGSGFDYALHASPVFSARLDVTVTCPDSEPTTGDLAGIVGGASGQGALLDTSHTAGPPANRVTDLRVFAGATDTGQGQTWSWQLTGSGAAPSPAPPG